MSIDVQIKQVWAVEKEILDVIHNICIEHDIRYTLAYGTLIGAVRHSGFIPWDDDIDIMMPREDYEKFLSIWRKAAPKGFVLQNIRTDFDYTNTFSKVRKDNTTFLQSENEAEKKYHKGIFVDIFPADRVAKNKLANLIQYISCAVNLLYTRGYKSGSKGVIGLLEGILLSLPKKIRPILRDKSENIIRKYNGDVNLQWFVPSTIEYAKHYYPSNLFDNMSKITFCGREYMCVENQDAFLRADYGDYMQLPPEEERVWKHHPIVIDFEHNYEELTKDND